MSGGAGCDSKANICTLSPAPGRAISLLHTKPSSGAGSRDRLCQDGRIPIPFTAVPPAPSWTWFLPESGGGGGLSSAEGLTEQRIPHSFHRWNVTPGGQAAAPARPGPQQDSRDERAASPYKHGGCWAEGRKKTGMFEVRDRGTDHSRDKLHPAAKYTQSWKFSLQRLLPLGAPGYSQLPATWEPWDKAINAPGILSERSRLCQC